MKMNPGHYHLAGIGGVGMSALAQVLLDAGAEVTGSDRFLDQSRDLEVFQVLRAAGVRLAPQDGSALHPASRALVVSTAVEGDNPDRQAAVRLGIPVRHRAEVLAELARPRPFAAIAGTCGKTTVTGMAGALLEAAGRDPWVVNGGAVTAWRRPDRIGSVRNGAGPGVIEADESDRSFLQFTPDWAVITNVSKDHFSLGESLDLFEEFAGRARQAVILGPQAAAALANHRLPAGWMPTLTFAQWESRADGTQSFTVEGRRFELAMPGRHNAENACAALTLARRLDAPWEALQEGLGGFRGIHRRLERTGSCGGAAVYDDYAHNPEKIRAAWTAVRATGARRILGVWRPHGFKPLATMRPELVAMWTDVMSPEDRLLLLPVFYAGGSVTQSGVTSNDVCEALRAAGRDAECVPDYPAIEAIARAFLRPDDALLIMGARDPELPVFAQHMTD